MDKYEDIINLPHHVSKTRKHMTIEQRSAQFAPFAALTGYSDEIKETARLTTKRIELDDSQKEINSNKLNYILDNLDLKPEVTFTYFVPDLKKKGGKYIDKTGIVRTIDNYSSFVILYDKTKIPINEIINIESKIFDDIENEIV